MDASPTARSLKPCRTRAGPHPAGDDRKCARSFPSLVALQTPPRNDKTLAVAATELDRHPVDRGDPLLGQNVPGRPVRDHPAMIQKNQPVTEPGGEREVVQHDDDAPTPPDDRG